MNDRRQGFATTAVRLTLLVGTSLSLMAGCGARIEPLADMQESVTGVLAAAADPAGNTRPAVALNGGFPQALRSAVETSRSYQVALSLEQQALSGIGIASSVRRPQLNSSGTVGAIRESGDLGSTDSGIAANLTVSQLLYDAGASAATINQATAEAISAQAERQGVANELALEAARAWIDVWQYRERLGLLRSRTHEMEEILSQIERMALNGMLDRAMLDDARRQIVSISLEESRLQADLREAQVRFAAIYNVRDARVDRPQDLIPGALARQEAARWQEAPSLRRAAADLIIARNEVTIAAAAFRPRARLQAGVSSPMDDEDTSDTSVGVAIEYTFGDGGRRRAQLETAEARLDAATSRLAESQLTVEAELEAAIAQLDAIQRAMPLLNENIRLSQSAAQTAQSQIATGQSNLRQLVDAEMDSYRSSDQQIAMQAQRLLLHLTIAARTGALAREIGLDTSPQG
ncbi:TolC family protein [Roseicyclus mahoneyensis]|uniref:Outer membrane protein TolC n=1 Tax=Roseicyclus mahoneyensis TaxID=164332 RepID=A0A316G2T2_9RHOB|nr:TolC family protein [Roseicyclus mahoneyensis]PWK55118.1 outer membrane protein TolC [Roseicyclus mahoneyensis]